MPDFDRDLEATLRGKLAGSTLEVLQAALDVLDAQIERQVMAILRQAQGLTADQALQAWYHKFALAELRQKLTSLASRGQHAARRITPQMEGSHAQA